MAEITGRRELLTNTAAEEIYSAIRGGIITAQNKISSTVNLAMVVAQLQKM